MALLYEWGDEVSAWMAQRLGLPAGRFTSTIGYASDGELKAALGFEGYTGSNVFAHIASDVTMPRSLLRAGCAYAFKQLNCARITFLVNDDNVPCQVLMDALQLRREGAIRCGHPKGHTYLFALWANHPFVQRLFKNSEVPHGR